MINQYIFSFRYTKNLYTKKIANKPPPNLPRVLRGFIGANNIKAPTLQQGTKIK